MSEPTEHAVRLPGEFEPHERTVLCWPGRADLYGELMPAAKTAHAEVARAISGFEPVTVIARPGAPAAEAADRCGSGVTILELPLDDSWFRDTGPIYVVAEDHVRATDWRFNGWGNKYLPFDRDALLAARYARLAGQAVHQVPMVLEGGSISSDGQGTLLTTAQCLLHPNRNPGLTRTEIETVLRTELGSTVIQWLPYGLADDDDTDGHVDNVAAFVKPGTVLLQGCNDPEAPDHARLVANRRWVQGATDASGDAIEVVEVPVLPFAEIGGTRVPVPYLNFYLGNGFVLVPVCGHHADAEMCAIIGEQFTDREVIALDVGAILAFGGGGIHCITQQVPSAPVHPGS
jgi:agmatine deiminase